MLATIPPPPFQNIALGPLTLHGYGLVLGIAMVAAMWITDWGLRFQGIKTEKFTEFAIIVVIGTVIGARLYHIASQPLYFWHHPAELPALWHGGLGIYGGILGSAITAWIFAPRFEIPLGALADASAPAMLVAQAIGRWGNYLNQELFGRPFNGSWALKVDEDFRPSKYLDQSTFHPTFLYESIANLCLAIAFIFLLKKWKSRASGVLFALYISAYSTVRILVEPLRIDSAHSLLGARQNVWVAGSLIIFGLAIAWHLTKRTRAKKLT